MLRSLFPKEPTCRHRQGLHLQGWDMERVRRIVAWRRQHSEDEGKLHNPRKKIHSDVPEDSNKTLEINMSKGKKRI